MENSNNLKALALDTMRKCHFNNPDGRDYLSRSDFWDIYWSIDYYIDESKDDIYQRTEAIIFYFGG